MGDKVTSVTYKLVGLGGARDMDGDLPWRLDAEQSGGGLVDCRTNTADYQSPGRFERIVPDEWCLVDGEFPYVPLRNRAAWFNTSCTVSFWVGRRRGSSKRQFVDTNLKCRMLDCSLAFGVDKLFGSSPSPPDDRADANGIGSMVMASKNSVPFAFCITCTLQRRIGPNRNRSQLRTTIQYADGCL